MGTDKRERQKANRAAKLEAERAAERRARRIQTIRNAVIAAVVLVLAMILISLLTGCGSADTDAEANTTTSTTRPPVACPTNDEGKAVLNYKAAPRMTIDPAKTYTATFETTKGTVEVEFDTERTPKTVNNFVTLARNCYYDATDVFRTEAATGILQGGSPHTQDNTDRGPGYTIEDEGGPFTPEDYAAGTIAMANTGQPDSASAQFFFLANEGGSYLGDEAAIGPSAGSYTVFGHVTEGLDVLGEIAALDDATGSGAPSEPVMIESVRITES